MSRSIVRRIALAGVAVLVGGMAIAATGAAHRGDRDGRSGHRHLLKANLNGAKEIPGPGDPDGRGKALIKVKPSAGRVCFALRWRDIGDPTMAHIHVGPKGVAGDIVVTLFAGAPDNRGCVEGLDETLLRAIRSDPRGYYVNIHNAEFPAGAIRGQLKRTGRHHGHFGRDDHDNGRHHGDDDHGHHDDD